MIKLLKIMFLVQDFFLLFKNHFFILKNLKHLKKSFKILIDLFICNKYLFLSKDF